MLKLEGETFFGCVGFYVAFGLLQLDCSDELVCGVVVLVFQARPSRSELDLHLS